MAMNEQRAVTNVPNAGLTMVVDFAQLKQRIAQLQLFVREYMVPGEDFGIIEGTGSKPTLLKPGAEKLCDVYGLSAGEAQIEFTRDDTKTPTYISYRVSLPLVSRVDGRIIMVGVGSANSWEKKHRWRWVFDNELPSGMSTEGLRTQTNTGRNGKPYTKYRVPNDEIDDIDNTLLKMAKKRALVDAVLSATRSSALFTQDTEDLGSMEVHGRDTSERDERRQQQPRHGTDKPATDKQLDLIDRKAKAKRLDSAALDSFVQAQIGKHVDQLSSKEASTIIDALDSYQPSGSQPAARDSSSSDPYGDIPMPDDEM